MRLKEVLVLGGLFGFVLVGAWFLVLRPTVPPPSPAPAPSSLPRDIARLLEQLTPEAREAYAFALERPEVLQYMPCYCGCVEGGHTANLSCFIRPAAGGGISLESHGST
ncbi:MAG: hypothetical protein HY690_10895 [Chloroflexi bacterium]|nr:hypothetical protein [Chloroflexota bacterium]